MTDPTRVWATRVKTATAAKGRVLALTGHPSAESASKAHEKGARAPAKTSSEGRRRLCAGPRPSTVSPRPCSIAPAWLWRRPVRRWRRAPRLDLRSWCARGAGTARQSCASAAAPASFCRGPQSSPAESFSFRP